MAPSALTPATAPSYGGFDLASFTRRHGGVTKSALKRGTCLFSQGDPASEMFYLDQGQIQLSVMNGQARRAIVGILTTGDFCGESCLADAPKQIVTATCLADSVIARIAQPIVIRAVHQDPGFAEFCVTYFLNRSARLTERLISQFFDSSESRLARILLQLSNHGDQRGPIAIRNLDQEALAQLIGTSRSRTNYFMNKFRDLGHIRYDGANYIVVHDSLSQVVSHETRGGAIEGSMIGLIGAQRVSRLSQS
jgi:CRP/FNR family transcriptional regulator, cyclic AMP receptor protein